MELAWLQKSKRMIAFNSLKIVAILCIALTFMGSESIVEAQEKKPAPRRILAIFIFKQGLPWAYRIEESLRAVLASESHFAIELNVEHADLSRYPDETYRRKIVNLYRYKYSSRKIDLVLVAGDELTDMFLEFSEELFADIPVVLISNFHHNLPQKALKPNMMSLAWGFDIRETFKLIQDVRPQTKHLFVISGASITDRRLKVLAIESLRDSDGKLDIQYLSGLAAENLIEKVTQLPKYSAILFLSLFRDANGQYFIPREIMSIISKEANAPTFGIVDTYLGHGIVGGSLLSAENQGKRFASIALNILRGDPIKNVEYIKNDNLPMFDWRELKRWSIDEERLPPDSIVRYREQSIWENHKGKIIGVIAIIFLQSFVLIFLLIQRKKRSQAEDESQRLRDELTHISRVLSMGEIAASLAHEINQPLAAIQSYAQAAQRFLGGDPPDIDEVGKSLHGVVAGNRRAKEVIRRIRMTLKKETLERSPLQVKNLIHDVIMLVQRNADEKKVLLKVDLAPGLPKVFGDRTQLQQVLLNLIINGFEAMGDTIDGSRELVVRASKNEIDSVVVSVQDSGIGINEENRDLLFNAFFTTKVEGLGMGLSISRSIIEDHGGQLWANQNPDKGTTFSFTVPIYMENQR